MSNAIVSYSLTMHIAHFVQRYPPALGGSEAYFARLAAYHESHGDTVDVWTTTAIDLEAFWRNGKREVPISDRRYQPLRFPLRRYVLKALSLIPYAQLQAATLPANPVCPRMLRDAGRYDGPLDAVHASAFPYAFPILCARRLAKRRKVPFFLTPFVHVGDPTNPNDRTKQQYTSRPLRWLLNEADGIFVQTHLEAEAVRECGVDSKRIIVQGMGVDPVECTGGDRARTRAEWGITDDDVVIGHLANNSVEKGTVDLLKAKAGRCRVILAGPEMPNFLQFWDAYQHQASVTRLGVLTEPQKRDFFAGIDIFCLPSRSDSFGLVLLEAWANRKPVVVYRAGGPSELVHHNHDGLVVDCDSGKLAKSLNGLVNSRLQQIAFGEAGYQRTLTEFRWPEKMEVVRSTIRQGLVN